MNWLWSAAGLFAVGLGLGCATGDNVDQTTGDDGAGTGASTSTAGGAGGSDGPSGAGAPTSSNSGGDNAGGAADGGGGGDSTSTGTMGCVNPATDCPATGTTCRIPICSNGACSVMAAMAGVACNSGNGTVCDGSGLCLPCIAHDDCAEYPFEVCSANQCVGATCNDAIQDGAELGVDCGGGTCPGCADGTSCSQPADCSSGACVSSTCAACGAVGQPCCPGGGCDAFPLGCAQNTGTMWGGTAQECNCGQLRPGQALAAGQSRWSCDGRFQLVMQGDGNLVLYYGAQALWSSDTWGTGSNFAVMQGDGNFVVYDGGGTPHFASDTSGASDWYLAIQNDGNVVVYDGNGTAHWATDTCCYP